MTSDPPRRPFGAFPLLVYDLSIWKRYLLAMLVPDAVRLPLVPGESKDDILRRIPEDFTGTFAFHINVTDASNCPHDRAGLVEALHGRGIRTLNAKIIDISKRFVQATCHRAGLMTTSAPRLGDPSEVLIVKTNRNYGGKPETHAPADVRKVLAFSEHVVHAAGDHGYLVAARRDIPSESWEDPNYVVERYIENAQHLFYRIYVFCDRIAVSEGIHDALVKAIRHSQRQRLVLFTVEDERVHTSIPAEIPSDLQPLVDATIRFTRLAQIDFGCLDVMRDEQGRFYIVDVNTTASWGPETEFRIIEYLSPNGRAPGSGVAAAS